MTVLILSLWALGVLLLIVFAVYRGKRAVTAAPTEMSNVEFAELSSKLRVAAQSEQIWQEIQRDSKTGEWKVLREFSPSLKAQGNVQTRTSSGAFKSSSSSKGTHVPFPKPGKSVR